MHLPRHVIGLVVALGSLIVTPTFAATAEAEAINGEAGTVSSASRNTRPLLDRSEWTDTPCPELTDSITRLYSAFFQRPPERSGFEFWTDAYASGAWNLDKMARHFVASDEFADTYGDLDNAAFIDLIYQNVQGRAGDADGRAYWLDQLDTSQMTRGRVMIFFSESEEYVTRSGTVRPMAGYLGWYPEGTTWACANGSGTMVLAEGTGFTDILITNFDRSDQPFTLTSYNRNSQKPILLLDDTLPADFYDYYRAWQFEAGDGFLEFELTNEMYWAVVDYPTAMVETRDGWG